MNTTTELLERTLTLFPASVVKAEFVTSQRKKDLALTEIVRTYTEQNIKEFSINNFGVTKQRVFLFNNPAGFNNARAHSYNLPNQFSSTINGNCQIDTYILKQRYKVVVMPTDLEPDFIIFVEFNQPFVIEIHNNYIILKLTMLEKNISSYLPNRIVYKADREINDEAIVSEFKTTYANNLGQVLDPLDINTGVKYLWNNNFIDAVSLRYKKQSSMATEVMDENFTFKNTYPLLFAQVMIAPLHNLTFKFINNPNDTYCDFACDPTCGTLSFHKYPKNLNQIQNVVSEIIRNN